MTAFLTFITFPKQAIVVICYKFKLQQVTLTICGTHKPQEICIKWCIIQCLKIS